jgi:hypothetical protein
MSSLNSEVGANGTAGPPPAVPDQVSAQAVGTSGGDDAAPAQDTFPSAVGEMLCSVLVQGLIDDDVASVQQQLALLKQAAAAVAARPAAQSDSGASERHGAIHATMANLLKNTGGDALNVEATVLIAATRHNCIRTTAALMGDPQPPCANDNAGARAGGEIVGGGVNTTSTTAAAAEGNEIHPEEATSLVAPDSLVSSDPTADDESPDVTTSQLRQVMNARVRTCVFNTRKICQQIYARLACFWATYYELFLPMLSVSTTLECVVLLPSNLFAFTKTDVDAFG